MPLPLALRLLYRRSVFIRSVGACVLKLTLDTEKAVLHTPAKGTRSEAKGSARPGMENLIFFPFLKMEDL